MRASAALVYWFATVVRPAWLVCLLAVGLPAQRTWIVDADNRAGTDFADIPPAITAAAPGDIIRVRIPSLNGYGYQMYSYHSPTAGINKPLFILGDAGPVRPRVGGPWYITGLGVGDEFLLAGVEVVNGYLGNAGYIEADQNPGAVIIFDNLKMTQPTGVGGVLFGVCALGIISHSDIDTHRGVDCGSVTMIDDSIIHCHNFPAAGFYPSPDGNDYSVSIFEAGRGGTEAVTCRQGTVIVSNSTLIGASATVQPYGLNAFSAVNVVDSSMKIGKGCTVGAGVTLGGLQAFLNNGSGVSYLTVDPATLVNSSWRSDLVQFSQAPLNGMRWTLSPGSLQIAHYANRQSISAVAIGPVATPWSTTAGIALGPVCIDPTSYSEYWDVTNLLGIASRTFAIPPGLPVGYQVALQCFELMPSGTINTSNAAVVQIRP